MRLVSVHFLQEGAVLARPVINSVGQVLLREGITLTTNYINRLKNYGFDVVFIEDDRLDDVEIRIIISEETRKIAYETIKKLSNYIGDGQENLLEMGPVRNTVLKMINDVLYNTDIVGNLSEIRGYDTYTFHHSINTTILALIMGIALGYSEQKLLELGMGVLMHDMGKIKVPDEILNKTTPLTEDEFAVIKRHTTSGYDILRKNQDISLFSAHIALQHHEKWDGGGYPRGLKGEEIHEYGRIAAIADVYEALSSKRVYRAALEPYQAYEYIMAHSGTHFEPRILNVFARNIAVYPTGCGVILNNGQQGNVIRQNPAFPNRPVVRALSHNDRPLTPPVDYNLSELPTLFIVGVQNK